MLIADFCLFFYSSYPTYIYPSTSFAFQRIAENENSGKGARAIKDNALKAKGLRPQAACQRRIHRHTHTYVRATHTRTQQSE